MGEFFAPNRRKKSVFNTINKKTTQTKIICCLTNNSWVTKTNTISPVILQKEQVATKMKTMKRSRREDLAELSAEQIDKMHVFFKACYANLFGPWKEVAEKSGELKLQGYNVMPSEMYAAEELEDRRPVILHLGYLGRARREDYEFPHWSSDFALFLATRRSITNYPQNTFTRWQLVVFPQIQRSSKNYFMFEKHSSQLPKHSPLKNPIWSVITRLQGADFWKRMTTSPKLCSRL